MSHGVDGIDQPLHRLVEDPATLILAHLQFALNHAHFAAVFLVAKEHVLHTISHQFNRGIHTFCRAVDVVLRDVVRGGSVGLPAQGVDDRLDISFRAFGVRAAGNQMFEHVADAHAQILALEGAAGVLDETTHRRYGRRMVFLHDGSQPAGQFGERDSFADVFARDIADLGFGAEGVLAFGRFVA